MPECFDVVVVGAGVGGTMIARELARYRLNVLVIEKGADVSPACSKASNSVVHADSGPPGTNIREFTAESHRLYDDICRELSVEFTRCGELLVALEEEELPELEERLEAAKLKGVDMQRLTPAEILEMEPNVAPNVLGGALAPSGAVVYAFELAIALYENATANGVSFLFGTELTGARRLDDGGWQLSVARRGLSEQEGSFVTRFVVNAAGAWGGKVAVLFGHNDLDVAGMIGQRVILDRKLAGTVKHVVDRVSGSGVVVPTGHGNLLLGRCDGELVDVEDYAYVTARGIETIINEGKALVPSLGRGDLIRSFAGVWPERADILVEASKSCPGLVNVCLPPPGLTACPGAAKRAVYLLEELGLELREDDDFNPYREPIPDFSEMSAQEQAEMIKGDSRWGRIVCRCEAVTEGEIVEAIRRGARTLDGVKYRVRAGMGRCQGGFCGPRILAILARELGRDMSEITKKGDGSWMITPRARERAGPSGQDRSNRGCASR